jgi:hypothetical protein
MKRLLVLGAILGVLAGCSGNQENEVPTPQLVQLTLPFDAYKWNPREQGTYELARRRLVGVCVTAQGLAFTMPSNAELRALPDYYDNSRRYGIVGQDVAARFGYHLPTDAAGQRRSRDIDQWNKTVDSAQEAAIYGDGGCYEQADRQLGQAVPAADVDWLTTRSAESLATAKKADDVVQATTAWRACMAADGFDYPSPTDSLGDPRWNIATGEVSADEVRVAVTDARCKESSGLLHTLQTTETAWQRQVIADNPERFRAIADQKQAMLANASRTVG